MDLLIKSNDPKNAKISCAQKSMNWYGIGNKFRLPRLFFERQYINDVYLQGVINMIVKIMIKLLSTNCKALVSFLILVNQTSFLNKMQQSSRNGLVFCGKKCTYISWTNWNDVF